MKYEKSMQYPYRKKYDNILDVVIITFIVAIIWVLMLFFVITASQKPTKNKNIEIAFHNWHLIEEYNANYKNRWKGD